MVLQLALCNNDLEEVQNTHAFVFWLIMQENLNSKSYISTIKMQVLENLRCIQHAPGVQMQEVSSTQLGANYIQPLMSQITCPGGWFLIFDVSQSHAPSQGEGTQREGACGSFEGKLQCTMQSKYWYCNWLFFRAGSA